MSLYLFARPSLGEGNAVAGLLRSGPVEVEEGNRALDDPSGAVPIATAARLLCAFGLAERRGSAWWLTGHGHDYAINAYPQSADVTEEQAVVARAALVSRPFAPLTQSLAAVLRAIDANTNPQDDIRAFARLAGWDENTMLAQWVRYLNVLQEVRLLAPASHRLTPAARDFLEAVPLPRAPRDDARVWLIRAGANGENEELAQRESVSVIGWSRTGALTAGIDRPTLRDLIRDAYGGQSEASLSSQASTPYRFVHEVREGDVVVLPLKTTGERRVAVGVITGPYAFAATDEAVARDAAHRRATAWLAWGVPYSRFDDDLQAAFGARGTLSEIGRPDAAERVVAQAADDDDRIHLVLKWSERHGPRTIEDHRSIAEEHGEVWWSVIGRNDRRKLAQRWQDRIEHQLEQGEQTFAYISGPTSWVTEIIDITDDPARVDRALVAAPDDDQHSLWVKVANFQPTERGWLLEHLDLASSAGTRLTPGALGNQTNPLIVRAAGRRQAATRRVWWVNQGQTYAAESAGGFLWAPKLAVDGSSREFWRALEDATIGDLVLHHVNGRILAVSTVTEEAVEAPRPDAPEDERDRDGWLVATEYRALDRPLSISAIPDDVRLQAGRPFNRDGAVVQGYFFPLSDSFVNELASDHPQLGLAAGGPQAVLIEYTAPTFPAIETELEGTGLLIDQRTLRRYHLALATRGFVILAGISGGGKTWLAEAYAKAVGAVALVVPVAPNWTTNEDLIGFASPIDGEYRHTSFSQFLQRAAAEHASAKARGHEARPYHLILDEMNLARVEYYFAKFLSAMEQRSRDGTAPIALSGELEVLLTPNLKFVGTVNVDETTFTFADKVYDRAQLIELDAPAGAIREHLASSEHGAVLFAIWTAVQPVAPFAFRVIDDIKAYVDAAGELGVAWQEALDDQLLQKVLPKVKGASPALGEVLETLVRQLDPDFPLSARKARAMLAGFEDHGLVSYF